MLAVKFNVPMSDGQVELHVSQAFSLGSHEYLPGMNNPGFILYPSPLLPVQLLSAITFNFLRLSANPLLRITLNVTQMPYLRLTVQLSDTGCYQFALAPRNS